LPKTQQTQEQDEEQQASARPFWSGTLSFGLVSIPVSLYPANGDSRVSLRTLGPDGQPLKREYYAPETGKDVETTRTTRAYEAEQGEYITVTDEELERLAPEKSRDIDLRLFVKREEISPLYFQRAYFLTPAGGSGKAYRLLAETMQKTGRAGIATFVMRGKEYLVAIFADDGILTAETLRFSDEIRSPEDIGLPKKKEPSKAVVRRFEESIGNATKRTLDPDEMHDEYSNALFKLIEKKYAQRKDVVESEEPRKKPEKVVDLMEVLKRSLKETEKSSGD
jgi:DNA end-binding protein Ku